MGQKVIIRFW